jgi:hypothetical protein
MPPAEIRKLVEKCITRHIERYQWEILQKTEAMERETLETMRADFVRDAEEVMDCRRRNNGDN